MKKRIRISTKRTIRLCLLILVVLFYHDVRSNELFQENIDEIIQKELPEKNLNNLDSGLMLKEVPTLLGVQPTENLVQSVSYLKGKKLESSPVNLLSNSFVGQLGGLYAEQTNGVLRFDNPELSVRGRNPLIVVDGVLCYNMISKYWQNLI